jgi:beta-barrel assembly-enhancing protease
MSHERTNPPAADPNRLKVAPPPPPPMAQASLGPTGGFNPQSGRLFIEVVTAIALVVALGVGVIVAGGRIAAWSTPLVPLSVDRSLGEMSQKQLSLLGGDCESPEPLAYVLSISETVLRAAGPSPFPFKFRVDQSEEVNAFALPGGFVTVNFGLLQAAETGEEVAGVIGHEIQHALLRHGTKRMLRQMGSGALLFLVFGGGDLHGLGQTAGQFASLSYDRAEESEADQRGVELVVRAGIGPRGMVSFFERLQRDSIQPPALLSTHPDPGDRAALVARSGAAGPFKSLPSPHGLRCGLAVP